MTRHPLPMRVFNDDVDGDETKTTTKQQMMMMVVVVKLYKTTRKSLR